MAYQVIWEKNAGNLQGSLPVVTQGGTLETITVLALYRDGTAIDLSSKTVTATATDSDDNTTDITGTLTGANGYFTWDFSAGDVGTDGVYNIVVSYTDGAETWPSDPVRLIVLRNPSATVSQNSAIVGVSVANAAYLTALVASAPDGVIDEDDMVSDSDTAVPTQQSVKAYVDANVGGGDVGNLTTAGLTATNMLRVAAAGGLEERTPAQVLSDIGAETAGAAAAVQSNLTTHTGNTSNPHSVTAAQVSALPLAGGTLTGNVVLNTGVEIRATSGQNLILSGRGSSISKVHVTNETGFAPTLNITGSGSAELEIQGLAAVAATDSSQVNIGGGFSLAVFQSPLQVVDETAVTATTNSSLRLYSRTTGTAANGFGGHIYMSAETTTSANADTARIAWSHPNATHATRTGDLILYASDFGGEREGIRVRADGSAPALGVLGATPVVRQAHITDPAGGTTVDAEARTAINSLIDILEAFGFSATS